MPILKLNKTRCVVNPQSDMQKNRCYRQERSVAVIHMGDFVLSHVSYAIQKMSAEAASSTWELLEQLLAEEIYSA
jgi:hydrogenase maturation factor